MSISTSLQPLLLLDIVLLFGCAMVLLRFGRLSALHPGTTYLFFHAYCVTLRLFQLSCGAAPLPVLPGLLTTEEMIRAALVSDLALVSMTVGWLCSCHSSSAHRRLSLLTLDSSKQILSKHYILIGSAVTFVIGICGLLNFGWNVRERTVDFGQWNSSAYLYLTTSWPMLALLMLHYAWGFPKRLLCVTPIILYLMAINAPRYVTVISIVYLCFVYLSRRKVQWFPLWMILLLICVGIVWIPLKAIAISIRNDDSIAVLFDRTIQYYDDVLAGDKMATDMQFLDVIACTITAEDAYGKLFYGTTVLPILAAPIPRQLWPDKPPQNEYQVKISTPERPIQQLGMVSTLTGECYVNFGYFGVALIPFLLAFVLGRVYFRARRLDHNSVGEFVYILLAANLIQVYRDGLSSFIVFPVINFMPLTLMAIFHRAFPPKRTMRQQVDAPLHVAQPWVRTKHA